MQSANLVFTICSHGDYDPSVVPDLYVANCAFMPNLINLRKVTLTLEIGYHLDPEDLERPLPVVQAVIQSCCLLSRATALSVEIEPGYNSADTLQVVLPPIIDALSNASIVSLTLGPTFHDNDFPDALHSPEEATRLKLQGMLTQAGSLRLSSCWLNWMTGELHMQNLVELEFTIGDEMFQEAAISAISEHLPGIITGSGPRFKCIKLNSDLSYDSIVENGLFVTALPPLHREIDHLFFGGSTFTMMRSLLSSLSCKRIDLTISSTEDWPALEGILCRKPCPVPRLQVLAIRWRNGTNFGDARSQWKLHYTVIRQAVHKAGARMTLDVQHYQSGAIQDTLGSLRHVQEELLVFDCRLRKAPFDPLVAYESRTPVKLPACARLSFHFTEDAWAKVNLSAQSSAFLAIMRYLEAPCVEELALSISAPHPGHIVGLIDAIVRGQFPRLKRLVGSIRHCTGSKNPPGSATSPWASQALASYKTALQTVCAERDIATHELRWY